MTLRSPSTFYTSTLTSCLVPRPQYYASVIRFGSRGPGRKVWPLLVFAHKNVANKKREAALKNEAGKDEKRIFFYLAIKTFFDV